MMDREHDTFPAARWWHTIEPGRFECLLCPRRCRLTPGRSGYCLGRRATDDGLVASTYGRVSAVAVDPIEKKPLHHFLPGSAILSIGSVGCNLACAFCQNINISKPEGGRIPADTLTPGDLVEAARLHACPSVAFTYNEPITFAEYVVDASIAAHAAGLRTVAVTAGYITEHARGDFFAHLDAANIDLKFFRPETYRRLSGVDRDPILETLRYVARHTRTHLEVTTLVIPGVNDADAELSDLTGWIAAELGPDTPLHLSAFHGAHRMADHPSTPASTLRRARDIARQSGLRYVYIGNVAAAPGENDTQCPSCARVLISRDGWRARVNGIRVDAVTPDAARARCASCGHEIPGVFG